MDRSDKELWKRHRVTESFLSDLSRRFRPQEQWPQAERMEQVARLKGQLEVLTFIQGWTEKDDDA